MGKITANLQNSLTSNALFQVSTVCFTVCFTVAGGTYSTLRKTRNIYNLFTTCCLLKKSLLFLLGSSFRCVSFFFEGGGGGWGICWARASMFEVLSTKVLLHSSCSAGSPSSIALFAPKRTKGKSANHLFIKSGSVGTH